MYDGIRTKACAMLVMLLRTTLIGVFCTITSVKAQGVGIGPDGIRFPDGSEQRTAARSEVESAF